MSKAKAPSKTLSEVAIEPALFTHDGYRLHVIDGVPYMTDDDLADRLGFGQDRDIRKLIKRQEANLRLLGEVTGTLGVVRSKPRHGGAVSNGLLRRDANRKAGARGPIGAAYYLNQQQVRWIVIKSETPEADVLLRQILGVFDAWEKGQLVSRAEAAEARAEAAEDRRPVAQHPNWPRYYGHEHSLFLMAGAPAAIPSGFIESVSKDNRFTRFATTLDLTVTATEDQIRIFDVDLGHAIGGQCTNKVRPRVRELQGKLRLRAPTPGTRSRPTATSATATTSPRSSCCATSRPRRSPPSWTRRAIATSTTGSTCSTTTSRTGASARSSTARRAP
ncbi:hypothetical protein [Bosea sp. TND4EK4]|uniref:hypothetical protein n=1 Tax=Bosea sp. TND4EK4 TaxID=1907408 RepID=UPI000953F60F|nr:hypothetical protein [Bosea sp. TND4EK4]SIR35669.1 hypothetical protein SAMN05880592_11729 [Bosea sp. TND4EK4]